MCCVFVESPRWSLHISFHTFVPTMPELPRLARLMPAYPIENIGHDTRLANYESAALTN